MQGRWGWIEKNILNLAEGSLGGEMTGAIMLALDFVVGILISPICTL